MTYRPEYRTPHKYVTQQLPRAGLAAGRPDHGALVRRGEFAALLALWPEELADSSRRGAERVLALLRRALRAERQRGLAGHWTYDLNRHERLRRAYRDELKAFHRTHGLWPIGHAPVER